MINILYNIINTALNKNQMGKISPSEYNSALFQAMSKNYAEIYGNFRKLSYRKMRFQDSAGYGDEVFNLKQVLEYYVTEKEFNLIDGITTIPEEVNLIHSVFDDDVEFEKTDLNIFNILKRSNKFEPTACSPIYTLNDSKFKLLPAKNKVDITYFRKLKQPKWTYIIANGVEMFNPDASDFQDIDMHYLMLPNLFIDVLAICGLNLQMDQVQNYVNMLKQEAMVNKQ